MLRFTPDATLEELVLRHALGMVLHGFVREPGAAGVMMLPIPKAGVLWEVGGMDQALAVRGIEGLEITIPLGQPVVPLPEGNRYLGFIFARGKTPDDVENTLRVAYSRVAVRVEDDSGGRTTSRPIQASGDGFGSAQGYEGGGKARLGRRGCEQQCNMLTGPFTATHAMNVLLISCYELGHQPFAVASAAAHVLAGGRHHVECLDLAIELLDEAKVRRADFVGISIPMHTAIRLGVKAGELVRGLNPQCHISYFGLYASLNEDYLLEGAADSVIGGEFETPLTQHVDRLAGNGKPGARGVSLVKFRGTPNLSRQQFLPPARHLLPPLEKYARLRTSEGDLQLVGYVEASRGCAHRCRHCPIPAVYEGRLRIVQQEVVLADIANLVCMVRSTSISVTRIS